MLALAHKQAVHLRVEVLQLDNQECMQGGT